MAEEKISELKRHVDEQARALGSLASSLEGEDRLRDLFRRLEGPCKVLRDLVAGVGEEGGEFVLSWPELWRMFLQYLEFKRR